MTGKILQQLKDCNPTFLAVFHFSIFIHTLWNIGILLHKQATQGKHFCPECTTLYLASLYYFDIEDDN